MEIREIKYRVASPSDAKALLDIYRPYVEHTAITFEYDVPSQEEFQLRIEKTLKRYPYIVAYRECEGAEELVGYAYTGPLKSRAAYDWSVETSIYVREDMHKQGVGKGLYKIIEVISARQHITNLYACIAYPEVDDMFLDKNSVEYHKHMGYVLIGEYHKCGYKFDRWYNMVWMEKIISDHSDKPLPLIHFETMDLGDIQCLQK